MHDVNLKLFKEAGFADITAFLVRLQSINTTCYVSCVHTSCVHRLQQQQQQQQPPLLLLLLLGLLLLLPPPPPPLLVYV